MSLEKNQENKLNIINQTGQDQLSKLEDIEDINNDQLTELQNIDTTSTNQYNKLTEIKTVNDNQLLKLNTIDSTGISQLSKLSDIETSNNNQLSELQDINTFNNNILFCDNIVKGITIAEWENRLICEGKGFLYGDYKQYTNGQVVEWIFDPTAYTGDYIYFIFPSFAATGGPLLVDFYVGATYTGGTQQTVVGLKSDGSVVQSKVIYDVTIVNPGVRTGGRLIHASGSSPATAAPAESASRQLTIFSKTLVNRVRIQNTIVSTVYVQHDFLWFEI